MSSKARLAKKGGSNPNRIVFTRQMRRVWAYCSNPDNVKPVGYKWVFVRKRNEKNEVVRYKAHGDFLKDLGLIMMKRIHL